ncbi:hypothetical protein [Synechococcus sp. BMK-MC-1]|uniref:hypothetical protein n=1 Tax=Synechococcus sp. BMK-MC-1 TaxID=1442551 RepID=UPI0016478495|nr:hypothetical protein [Synechococcus sp. BMK-MC-1]QNI67417.1 hypothetical protein SynBMKMC1_01335 [Synechococcus sp. BMK-MC-1]
MNRTLPDRWVIAILVATVLMVFALAFSLRAPSPDGQPFLWRDSGPTLDSTPSNPGTLAI